LVRDLRAGDRAAFTAVYRRHNAAMVRFATTILRDRSSAEEVAQDTWLAVLRNIGGFEGRSSLAGWIFTILANRARTRAVRDGRSVVMDLASDGGAMDDAFDATGHWRTLPGLWEEITPERIVAGRSLLDHVTRIIDDLPPAQRAVLTLRGQNGLEAAEVCAMLEISEGNMRVLLHRARLAVRTALDTLLA
jgi:RNA polymerase sigma-70 factor (ECF subfamily)